MSCVTMSTERFPSGTAECLIAAVSLQLRCGPRVLQTGHRGVMGSFKTELKGCPIKISNIGR